MVEHSDSPLDRLWAGYGKVFQDFDDLTLARWMAQTLGHLEEKCWRMSHPLLGSYRLAAQAGHQRQIWLKHLVSMPHGYVEAECCRAPLLPIVTRDVLDVGLVCQHCSESAVPYADLPRGIKGALKLWATEYGKIHEVAHIDDSARGPKAHYDRVFEEAAQAAERLLEFCGAELAPKLLEHYPAVVWEDQDECLEVRPEDLQI